MVGTTANQGVTDDHIPFPFILCTPTMMNNNDVVEVQTQETTFGDDESSKRMIFYLKPRRSRLHPLTGSQHEREHEQKEKDMSTEAEPSWQDNFDEVEVSKKEKRGCNSPSSPVQQVYDTPFAPPVLSLLERCRRPSQDDHQEGEDACDVKNLSIKMLPLFPILGPQSQQHPPVLLRPVARPRR